MAEVAAGAWSSQKTVGFPRRMDIPGFHQDCLKKESFGDLGMVASVLGASLFQQMSRDSVMFQEGSSSDEDTVSSTTTCPF